MTPTMARDSMRYWRIAPDARLRPWIHCYWRVEPDTAADALTNPPPADAHQLLIPDGHSEIVFHLAGSFSRWRLDEPGRPAVMRASYVIGGRSHSVMTRSVGGLRLAGVKLDPRALRALTRTPLGELRDATLAIGELGCGALLELESAVAETKTSTAYARVLDRFFLRELACRPVRATGIEPLIELIHQSRGATSILRWAREHAYDPRTLERRFVGSMGMTPKQYARVVRFKHTYHRLATEGRGRVKSHLDAYYDESHFNREFRHFLGTSPLKWLTQGADFRTTVADHLLAGEFERASPAA